MASRKRKEQDDASHQSRLLQLPDVLLAMVLSFFPIPFAFRDGPLICRRIHQVYKTCGRMALAPELELCLLTEKPHIPPVERAQQDAIDDDQDGCWKTRRATDVLQRLVDKGASLRKLVMTEYSPPHATGSGASRLLQLLLTLAPQELDSVWTCLVSEMDKNLNWSIGDRLDTISVGSEMPDRVMARILHTAPNLRRLSIYDPAKFTASSQTVEALGHATNLRSFRVGQGMLELEQLVCLARACSHQLEEFEATLDIDCLCEQGVKALADFCHLTTLDIEVDLDDERVLYNYLLKLDMTPLKALNKLEKVKIGEWPFENNTSLDMLFASAHTLTFLYLPKAGFSEGGRLTGSMLRNVLLQATRLKTLRIGRSPGLMCKDAFQGVIPPALTTLEIRGIWWDDELDPPSDRTSSDLNNILPYLYNWPSLRTLRVEMGKFTPITSIKQLNPRLQSLHLTNLELDEKGTQESNLAELVHLRHLTLSAFPSVLTDRTMYKEMDPECAMHITNKQILAWIKDMSQLETLDLGFARLDTRLLDGLVDKKRLRSVIFASSPAIHSDSILDATEFWKVMHARNQDVMVSGSCEKSMSLAE